MEKPLTLAELEASGARLTREAVVAAAAETARRRQAAANQGGRALANLECTLDETLRAGGLQRIAGEPQDTEPCFFCGTRPQFAADLGCRSCKSGSPRPVTPDAPFYRARNTLR